jgi:hypothetical protein
MMTRRMLSMVALMMSLNACATAPISHFSVNVVDEENMPVEGATVQGYFTNLKRGYVPGPARISTTDVDGKANITGPAYFAVNVKTKKEGYYISEKKIPVNIKQDQNINFLLRSKKNPIAMYAKKVLVSARGTRRIGEQFGYDFMVGDFVLPHGKGKVSDLIITHTYYKKDSWNYSYEIAIKFSNPGDGLVPFFTNKELVESAFKSDYKAPKEGYINEWNLNGKREGADKPVQENLDKNRNYYFRVRTETDKEGNIESAYYGKIYGEFLSITYYLNPTPNDRNVEFDSEKNLFKDIRDDEKVWDP